VWQKLKRLLSRQQRIGNLLAVFQQHADGAGRHLRCIPPVGKPPKVAQLEPSPHGSAQQAIGVVMVLESQRKHVGRRSGIQLFNHIVGWQ
jgi:hypothetical protein